MSSIGDIVIRSLRGETVLYEEALANLLKSDKKARRQILCDRELRDSVDLIDQRFYQAVSVLARQSGDIETLSYEIHIEEEPEPVSRMSGAILQGEENLDSDEPSIGNIIVEMYGKK